MPIAKVLILPKCRLCGKIGKQTVCGSCRDFWNLAKQQEKAFQHATSYLSILSQQRMLRNYQEIKTLPAMLRYLNECIYMLRSRQEYQHKMRAIYTRFQTLTPR